MHEIASTIKALQKIQLDINKISSPPYLITTLSHTTSHSFVWLPSPKSLQTLQFLSSFQSRWKAVLQDRKTSTSA